MTNTINTITTQTKDVIMIHKKQTKKTKSNVSTRAISEKMSACTESNIVGRSSSAFLISSCYDSLYVYVHEGSCACVLVGVCACGGACACCKCCKCECACVRCVLCVDRRNGCDMHCTCFSVVDVLIS